MSAFYRVHTFLYLSELHLLRSWLLLSYKSIWTLSISLILPILIDIVQIVASQHGGFGPRYLYIRLIHCEIGWFAPQPSFKDGHALHPYFRKRTPIFRNPFKQNQRWKTTTPLKPLHHLTQVQFHHRLYSSTEVHPLLCSNRLLLFPVVGRRSGGTPFVWEMLQGTMLKYGSMIPSI